MVKSDDLYRALVLEIAKPYLCEVAGVYGDWTPRRDRRWPFSKELDKDDPRQFRNIRVTCAGSDSAVASGAVPYILCAGQFDKRNRQCCLTRKSGHHHNRGTSCMLNGTNQIIAWLQDGNAEKHEVIILTKHGD